MEKSSLGDRMKGYEAVTRTKVMGRTPTIIRLDGKAFHTYTSKMPRPFYEPLHALMVETTNHLCNEIETVVVGYTQSDEISLLLKDWTKFSSQAWFGGQVQKMVSTSAAIATAIFNDLAPKYIPEIYRRERFGLFDSRVFNLPETEVCNYFIWRQQDAIRNSIQASGQAQYSQKELNNKSTLQIQEMLTKDKKIVWDDYPTWAKQGTCVRLNVQDNYLADLILGSPLSELTDQRRIIDTDTPVFSKNRNYINDLLYQTKE